MNFYWFPIAIFSDFQLLNNSNDITSVDSLSFKNIFVSIFRCELPGNSDDFDSREFLIGHSAIISMVDCCNESERDVMSSRNWFLKNLNETH